jgi:hypothetical protein
MKRRTERTLQMIVHGVIMMIILLMKKKSGECRSGDESITINESW